MNKWPSYYVLVGRTPMAVDMMTWALALEDRHKSTQRDPYDWKTDPWKIGHDDIDEKCHVSTVFIGLDHSFGDGDPVLFETMIFGGALDESQWRYCTYDEAERGHAEAVTQAKIAAAKIKSIADAAGVKVKT